MKFPKNLKYTKDHEWALIEGKKITVGITDHAQSSLGDIVFVELPKLGRELKRGESFGVVESIKAVSDLYSPVSGKIIEINSQLPNDPGKINSDPYEQNWIVKLEVQNSGELDELMDASSYESYVKTLN